MKFVYCSGPLFCPEEMAGMSAIASVLQQAGFGTFLPHRDGLERHVMGLVNTPLNTNLLWARDMIDSAIFALDVFQIIRRCDYFVFNMNGRVPDEGAVAEAGMAFAAGKPLVLYKNDRRSVFKGSDNSMLTGLSVLKPVRDITKLPSALLQAENALKNAPAGCTALPPLSSVWCERARGSGACWAACLGKMTPLHNPGHCCSRSSRSVPTTQVSSGRVCFVPAYAPCPAYRSSLR